MQPERSGSDSTPLALRSQRFGREAEEESETESEEESAAEAGAQSNFLMRSAELWPPKPKLLLRAAVSFAGRAVLGTMSTSTSGSRFSTLMVGGTI